MRSRLAVALLALTACAQAGTEIRKHTYPPDFHYITEAQLSSAMWRLAKDATALDALLHEPANLDSAAKSEVVAHLDGMIVATGQLEGGAFTNHPMLNLNLDRFQRDLVQAKAAAERDPPSYFLAGAVGGSCLYCHGGKR